MGRLLHRSGDWGWGDGSGGGVPEGSSAGSLLPGPRGLSYCKGFEMGAGVGERGVVIENND